MCAPNDESREQEWGNEEKRGRCAHQKKMTSVKAVKKSAKATRLRM
jgi:hypothetical protein